MFFFVFLPNFHWLTASPNEGNLRSSFVVVVFFVSHYFSFPHWSRKPQSASAAPPPPPLKKKVKKKQQNKTKKKKENKFRELTNVVGMGDGKKNKRKTGLLLPSFLPSFMMDIAMEVGLEQKKN